MQRFLMTTALCAIGVLDARSALAQTSAATDASTAGRADPNEIVVTAQRREQSAQDVGIALTVVGSAELLKRGIANVNDLQQAVPNLSIEPAFGSGQAQFRIRGVGFQDYATNNSPTVGIYVNEVAYPVSVMTQGLIFDIARIEVLRGPQGTLYGRNTTGGAINFITNKPQDTLGAGLSAEYGRFNAFKGEAYVTGPLAPGLDFRLSAGTEQGGAFQHNRVTGQSLGDANKLASRGLLRYTDGGFSATLEAHGGYDHSENVGLYLLTNFQTTISPAVIGIDAATGNPVIIKPAVLGALIPADADHRLTGWSISPQLARDADLPGDKPGRHNSTYGGSLNSGYDLGGVKLTSITSYDKLKRREYGDYDASASIEADVFFRSRVHVFSEEARLSSTGSGPLTWVAGVYYSEQDLKEQYFSDFTNIYGTYARVSYSQKVRSISGFGQAEYKITPTLNLVGGLRYEEETRKLNGFGSAFGGAQALPPTTVSTKMKPATGKVALEYKPMSTLLVYASASKGVKSGGFTTYNTGSASGIAPFKPEKLYAYEVGFKATASRAVQFNATTFYYDYRDQQVLDAICGGPVGLIGRFANAKKSRIWGVEAEAQLHPVGGLTIAPYASYTRGKYIDYQSLDGSFCTKDNGYQTRYADRAGQRIPFVGTTAGATVSYEVSAGAYVVTPSTSISYRGKSRTWLDQLRPGVGFAIPAYTLVNADLSFGPASRKWSAALWGRNIFNKQYDLTRNFFTGANIAQPGRPATYGVRVGFKY